MSALCGFGQTSNLLKEGSIAMLGPGARISRVGFDESRILTYVDVRITEDMRVRGDGPVVYTTEPIRMLPLAAYTSVDQDGETTGVEHPAPITVESDVLLVVKYAMPGSTVVHLAPSSGNGEPPGDGEPPGNGEPSDNGGPPAPKKPSVAVPVVLTLIGMGLIGAILWAGRGGREKGRWDDYTAPLPKKRKPRRR